MQQKIRKIFLSVLPFFAVFIPILLSVPQSAQALEWRKLIPVGRTVGVTMDTEGLLVLETGSVVGADNESHEPSKGLLKAGDRILQANGEKQENKEAFMKTIQQSEGKPICLRLERNGRQKEVKITPVLSNTAQTYQIGAWIRDSIQGIGTVTYYDAENGTFGALGHGVYDVDTDELMVIHGGSVVDTSLTEIVKGEKGAAGELIGQVEMQEKLAAIEKNTETGIYGKAAAGVFAGESYPVATKAEVKKGAAVLLSDLEGKGVQAYAMEIESLEKNGGRQHKDMNIRIMDERLLALTGGIVQDWGKTWHYENQADRRHCAGHERFADFAGWKACGSSDACDFGRPDKGLRHFHGKYGSINSERYAWQECHAYFSILFTYSLFVLSAL